jgi:protein ImuB
LEPLFREDLALRFGDSLVRRLDQAFGRVAEPVAACKLPPERTARWTFEHPATRRAEIELVVEQLVERVAAALARAGEGAVQLECRLACSSGGSVEFSVGLFHPTASADHLLELLRTRLDRTSLPGPAVAVELQAAVTAPVVPGQETLFDDRSQEDRSRELAALVDRLASRLGRRAVVRPRWCREAQPELTYRLDPLTGEASIKRRRGGLSRTGSCDLPPRPLRLFRRPVPLAAVSVMPDGPPLRLRLNGREHRVAWTTGPERIETGWWRGRRIGRDYYRVETTTAERYWLFRRLRDGRWFLHGAFE